MYETSNRLSTPDVRILTGMSAALFLYHMLTAIFSGYGYFIDEFYYLACARHPALGYVDHPPLSVLVLAANRFLLGESIWAARLLPALAAGATVFMTGLLARRLGGSRAAMILAGLGTMTASIYLVMASFYSMNVFEILLLTVILYFVLRLVQEEHPRHLVILGILIGLGLELKHTMLVYVLALAAGMGATRARRLLWNRWMLWGIFAAAVLALPNFLWQVSHGFVSLEFYRNALVNKNIPTPPLEVVLAQIKFLNVLALPLWVSGLVYLLASPKCRQIRFIGIAYLLLLAFMIVTGSSRPDRIGAVYTVLFAAGGVAVESISRNAVRRAAVIAVGGLTAAGGMIMAPFSTPLLPPPATATYLQALGLSFDIEKGKAGEALPQWLSDRLGWRDLAVETARVYRALSPEEQKRTVIISTSYGEAGALELYGRELELPPVYCTHNTYHLWGPPPDSATTYIAVFVKRRDLEGKFESVVEAGLQTCEYCSRPQRRIPIYLARGPKFSVEQVWPGFKSYD